MTPEEVKENVRRLIEKQNSASITPWPFLWLPKTGAYVAIAEIVYVLGPSPGVGAEFGSLNGLMGLKHMGIQRFESDDWPLIQAALSPPEPIYKTDESRLRREER